METNQCTVSKANSQHLLGFSTQLSNSYL